MSRFALVAALLVAACSSPKEGPPTDPARLRAFNRLTDGRSTVRIVSMKELAPKATRFETFAIAHAAKNEDQDVRRGAAEALGVAPVPEAVDLLGELLRDPMDGVRAAAVKALATKQDPKAKPYIESAWETGGPQTRAAVAAAGPDVLTRALAREAASQKTSVDEVLHFDLDKAMALAAKLHRPFAPPRPNAAQKANALETLGESGTPEAIAELATRLASDEPLIASAAAIGLARAGAADQLPNLIHALDRGPVVANAAALAIADLDPQPAADALVKALDGAPPSLGATLLEALEPVTLTAEQRAAICVVAKKSGDPAFAVALFQRAGPACAPDAALPADEALVAAQLLVHAALGAKSPALAAVSRTMLASPDAHRASAAAAYLGVFGEPSDANDLAERAAAELVAVHVGRARATAEATIAREALTEDDRNHRDSMRKMFEITGDKFPEPYGDKLSKLLISRRRTSETLPFEHRPGAIELVAAAGAAAARLGGDVSPLVDALGAEEDVRLRRLAVDVADVAGDAGEPLRAKLRASEDRVITLAMAERDVLAKRPDAVGRLLGLALSADVEERAFIAEVLAPSAVEAKAVLLAFARTDDASAPPALRALSAVPGADVEAVLVERAQDRAAGVAFAAVAALGARAGEAVDRALATAATHPRGVVRAAALEALAKHAACGRAPGLAPFTTDYERRVRRAAERLGKACPPAK